MKPARRNWIVTLVFASLAALAVGASGCVMHARASAGPTYDPPPPRYVEVDTRPGYVWVQGRWVWQYNQWQWNEGHWVRERPGYYYSQGHWTTRGSRRVWVKGTWGRGRPAVRTRDHRYRKPAPRSNRGNRGTWSPRTRDQRNTRGNSRGTWSPNKNKGNDNRRGGWSPGKKGKKPRVDKRDHRKKATPYKKDDDKKKKKSRVKRRDHR